MKIVKENKTINVELCNTFIKRLKGFMFKRNIDKCLCFNRCNCIHTFFMLKKIDVIMTDKSYNILYAYKSLRPFKIILPKKNVYYTFELPVGYFNYNINVKIKIK